MEVVAMIPETEEYSTNKTYYIFQLDEDYLEDAYEDIYDENEPNYEFTPLPTYAYKFYGDFNCKFFAPKYLYNRETGESIRTAQDIIDYFKGGKFIEVTETITKKYDYKKVEIV